MKSAATPARATRSRKGGRLPPTNRVTRDSSLGGALTSASYGRNDALGDNREIFSALVEDAPFGVFVVDSRFRLRSINAGAQAVFARIKPLVGRDFAEVLHDLWKEPFASETIAHFQQTLATGESFVSSLLVERRSSNDAVQSYDWRMHRVTLPDETTAVVCYFYDLSEQKKLEATLRRSEEQMRGVVSQTAAGIAKADPNGVILFANKKFHEMLGYREGELIGFQSRQLNHPDDLARNDALAGRTLNRGEPFEIEKRYLRKDGSIIWVHNSISALYDAKRSVEAVFAVSVDITERKKAEHALREARDDLERRVRERTAELQSMNDALEHEMERRQRLEREILQVTEKERARIGQDLHDSLCQELTATAFLLKSRAKSFRRQESKAAAALLEAAETVNDNAGLARDLARGMHPFELGSGGLVSALRELCARTTERVNCKLSAPATMRTDESTAVNLYRIAQEGITNALKHAKASEIVITLQRKGNDITLSIADNGKRAGDSEIEPGLGLHMMRYRANTIGGQLEIEQKRGRGTRVVCRVRASRA